MDAAGNERSCKARSDPEAPIMLTIPLHCPNDGKLFSIQRDTQGRRYGVECPLCGDRLIVENNALLSQLMDELEARGAGIIHLGDDPYDLDD